MLNHAWRTFRGDKRSRSFAASFCSGALTFIAVTVAWVFFRAESFAGAWLLITVMAGADGVSFPQWLADIPAASQAVTALSLDLRSAFRATPESLAWVTGLLLFAWLLPNTQQIVRNYMSGDFYSIRLPARWSQSIVWRPTVVVAISIAVIAGVAILSLDRPSEFIYYQF